MTQNAAECLVRNYGSVLKTFYFVINLQFSGSIQTMLVRWNKEFSTAENEQKRLKLIAVFRG